MSRVDQEAVTTFAEIFSTAGVTYHQQCHQTTTDSRPIIYFQGMKVYIPDGLHPRRFTSLTVSSQRPRIHPALL